MNYYNEIKEQLINNEIVKKVKDYSKNRSDFTTYYNVGKLLSEAGKHYGEGIINKFSINLTTEVDKKYNTTTLKRIRQFYWIIEKGATLWHQLSWSHYKLIITLDTIDKMNYYSETLVNNVYSVRQLETRIKNKEYERLPKDTRNKLIANNNIDIKSPILSKILITIKKHLKKY